MSVGLGDISTLISIVNGQDLFSVPPPGSMGPLQPTGGLAKAYIKIEGGEKLQCLFNPNKYSISKSNRWQEQPVVGKNLPQLQFGGGESRQMKFELLFDDSDRPNGDVKRIVDRLFAAMDVNDKFQSSKNTARPPMVEFGWGGTWTFKAVIEQLSVDFTLFRPDGVPVRAMAQIQLRQAEEIVGGGAAGGTMNPDGPQTSLPGAGGLGSQVVRAGDSLQSMAHQAYNDATQWRAIAEANNIDNPMALVRGAALMIPRLT